MVAPRIRVVACVALAIALPLPFPSTAQATDRTIEAHVSIGDSGRRVRVLSHQTLTNQTSQPLTSLPLFLYPRTLKRPAPDLDDVTFARRYPGPFDPGEMTILSATVSNQTVGAAPCDDGPGGPPWVCLALPEPLLPGGQLSFSIDVDVRVPRRFGPFGATASTLVMLGGWHPVVPALAPEGVQWEDHHVAVDYQYTVTLEGQGPLVVGDRLFDQVGTTGVRGTLDGHRGPVLIYAQFDGLADHTHLDEGRLLSQVARQRPRGANQPTTDVHHTVRRALEDNGYDDLEEPPFLLLEAPLRDVLAVPLQHGLLYSDLAFDVTGLRRLMARHAEDIRSALIASHLMTHTDMDLFDALVALNLVQFLRWDAGESDPLYLRRLLQKAEIWGALEKMGTDPQAHFQSAMFFTPELPRSLAQSAPLAQRDVPSPRSTARLLYLALGSEAAQSALDQALTGGSSFQEAIRQAHVGDGSDPIALAYQARVTDLRVGPVVRRGSGYDVAVCKSQPDSIPVEVALTTSAGREVVIAECPDVCCHLQVASATLPHVKVDPFGIHHQVSPDNDHPRLNDSNALDWKWMLSRPYLTIAGGDELPSMGIELQLEPRYDLGNRFFLSPHMNPQRGTVSLGWRTGMGRRVRPNYRAHSLTLGLRTAFPLDGRSGSLLGPTFIYTYYTRKSRMNPFAGTWAYGYAYPVIDPQTGDLGSRFGASISQLFGRSPAWVFAVRFNGDTGVGWGPSWDVAPSGGIDGLRAFGATQASRRHRVGSNLELRWMPIRNLHGSVMQIAYLTGLQFAFFVDAATIDDEIGQLFGQNTSYVDVGIGVRPHFDILGVLPAMVSLDVAYLPQVLGVSQSGINLVLSFYQPF